MPGPKLKPIGKSSKTKSTEKSSKVKPASKSTKTTKNKSNSKPKKMGNNPKSKGLIKAIKGNEQEGFKMLWRTGVASEKQFAEHFKIWGDRLRKLEKDGYITRNNGYIRLGDKGGAYCRVELKMRDQYKRDPRKTTHDRKLAREYLKLPPEQREQWVTEGGVWMKYKDYPPYQEMLDRSMQQGIKANYIPDAALYNPETGEYTAIEVVTNNYSQQDIEQKMEFAQTFFGGRIHFSN